MIEGGGEFARGKLSAGLNFLTALPPVRIAVIKNVLGLRVGLTVIRRVLVAIRGY